jgi:hyperosmotically inducible protein
MSIRKRFSEDKKIKYFDISTYVFDGHVYLVGKYESKDQKNQAVKVAREVEGVKSVTDYFLPKKKDDTCGTKRKVIFKNPKIKNGMRTGKFVLQVD